jgi:hypothetical protein
MRAVLSAAVIVAALVLLLVFFVGTVRTLIMAAAFIVLPLFLLDGMGLLRWTRPTRHGIVS